jgi:uncharacterized repeat protein (TIGR02543 family)
MNLKKWILSLFSVLFLLQSFCVPAMAAETPTFRYEITVDGKDTVEVIQGDTITVTLYLYRTDTDKPYTMYAMQDEIRYDGEFLELVADSALLSNGIGSADIAVGNGQREFYMNYVSLIGGAQWQGKTRIGSFQLKVTGESGVTTLTNEDFLVSLPDGSGSYKCEANTLTVILSTACTVKFETNGGTPIDPMRVIYGELLSKPATPVREGKHLVGWYKDIHLTEEWNFETDKVSGNMTLYAKWEDGEPDLEEPPTNVDDDTFDYRLVLILTPIVIAISTGLYLILCKLKKRN